MTKQKSEKHDDKSSKIDVIKLLTADHKKVKKLFKKFDDLKDKKNSAEKKAEVVKQICVELTIHAQAEEGIFYPAARKAINDDELIDEADVEHAGVKELIAQLQTMSPDESHYDAKVIVLSEYVKHHVKEEEDSIFPMIKKSKIDRQKVGKAITLFKDGLNKKKTATKPTKKTSATTAKKPSPSEKSNAA